MDPTQQQVETINAALRAVGGDLRAYAEKTGKSVEEVRARIFALEQAVANLPEGGFAPAGSGGPSLGARVVQTIQAGEPAYDHLARGNQGSAVFKLEGMGLHAALTGDDSSSTSYPSQPQRGSIVLDPQRPPRLVDALRRIRTARDTYEWVQLASDTAAAEQQSQGDIKAEVEYEGVLRSAPVATIAVWTSASRQVLSDHDGLQNALDTDLRGRAAREFERLLVAGGAGADAGSKITGLSTASTLFTPVVSTGTVDQIGECITEMDATGFAPAFVVMHPAVWHAISTERTAVELLYLYGQPTNPQRAALWGLPVVASPAMPADAVFVIDSNAVAIIDREAPQLTISTSHADYFIRNLAALRLEFRATLAVFHLGGVRRIALGS